MTVPSIFPTDRSYCFKAESVKACTGLPLLSGPCLSARLASVHAKKVTVAAVPTTVGREGLSTCRPQEKAGLVVSYLGSRLASPSV